MIIYKNIAEKYFKVFFAILLVSISIHFVGCDKPQENVANKDSLTKLYVKFMIDTLPTDISRDSAIFIKEFAKSNFDLELLKSLVDTLDKDTIHFYFRNWLVQNSVDHWNKKQYLDTNYLSYFVYIMPMLELDSNSTFFKLVQANKEEFMTSKVHYLAGKIMVEIITIYLTEINKKYSFKEEFSIEDQKKYAHLMSLMPVYGLDTNSALYLYTQLMFYGKTHQVVKTIETIEKLIKINFKNPKAYLHIYEEALLENMPNDTIEAYWIKIDKMILQEDGQHRK